MPRESAWAGKLDAVFSAAGSAGLPGRRRVGPKIGQTQRMVDFVTVPRLVRFISFVSREGFAACLLCCASSVLFVRVVAHVGWGAQVSQSHRHGVCVRVTTDVCQLFDCYMCTVCAQC